MRTALLLFVCVGTALAQQKPTAPPKKMPGMAEMPGMTSDSIAMPMPIPMPRGMPMMPGLVGLLPTAAPFLPGRGVDMKRLPAAKPTSVVHLKDGETLDLTAMLVRHTINGHTFTMYGFNGQIPGPLIRVPQNATIVVRYHNQIELPGSIHWHGVRLDNRYDGAIGVTQEPVTPGSTFIYKVHFPDAGIYWYHPHGREDIEQAMGLFADILVDSPDRRYYSPVNSEQTLILSDLLVNGDTLIPFGKEAPDFVLMGRVGNVLLVNGEPRYTLRVKRGEVVRFFLTDASASRTYNISFSGAPMKIVAADQSRYEHEERVESVVIAPAERYVVEARFERPGRYALVNSVQAINHYAGEFGPQVDTLGIITVDVASASPDYGRQFATLRANTAISNDIDRYRQYFDKPPDKQLTLTLQASALPLATVQFMDVDTAYYAPVEWVDGMPDMNWLSTSKEVRWILHDDATRKDNMDIDWHVKRGSVVKLRLVNDAKSFHPMQHPIHVHGQRMLVVARDGIPTKNLAWKDTAIIPVGSTVDLLIDASNPGDWMIHCHIAEHLGAGMMAVMHVDP